jgi:hypothetical protein
MSTSTWATVALGALLIVPVHGQRASRYPVRDEATITRTLSFAANHPTTQSPRRGDPAGGGRILDVRNINGSINVEATNDSAVQMSIRKVIRAETQDDLAEAQRDVRLDFREGAARVEATVTDRRGHVCGERNDDGDRRWDRVHYDVRFDFTIRVPRGARLRLCTINGGDIVVNGTQGDFEVDNVNGPIEMKAVAGSGRAHTVNGRVTATFTANPMKPSSFKTINGNVDVSFQDGLSAEFAMKTMNGGLFTDFDVQPVAGQSAAAGERRDGRFVYRANEFTRVRAGSGGPEITFATLNGNVRVRRSGGRTP